MPRTGPDGDQLATDASDGGVQLPRSDWVGPGGIRWSDLLLFLFGGIVQVYVGAFAGLIARFVDGVNLLLAFGGTSLRAVVGTVLRGATGVLGAAGAAAGPAIRALGPFAIVAGVAVMLATAYVVVQVFNGVVSRA
jgi:hypothetical protein